MQDEGTEQAIFRTLWCLSMQLGAIRLGSFGAYGRIVGLRQMLPSATDRPVAMQAPKLLGGRAVVTCTSQRANGALDKGGISYPRIA
jgi:hypothetical protein